MMQRLLLLAAVVAAMLQGGTLGLKATPAPTTSTTKKPTTTTPNYFYDEDDLVHGAAAHPITDHPVPAHHIPSGIKPDVYGYECTLQSVAYPTQFLRMSSGYVHYFPELKTGNPKSNDTGEWDWAGIWKITTHSFGRGEVYHMFHNQLSGTYMTYNATRYAFVRGVKKDYLLANMWDIQTAHRTAGSLTTIKHSQHPNGFLHALTQAKKDKPRAVGILVAEPDRSIYHWRIHCSQAESKRSRT